MKKAFLRSMFTFLLASLLGVSVAQAACDRGTCTSQIQRLYLEQKMLYVQLVGGLGKVTCTPTSNAQYLTIPVSSPVFREWHGMLLGAFLSDRVVSLRVNNTGRCDVIYIFMDR